MKDIETIINSQIYGKRPKKPASYDLRKLRKSKEDLVFCYNYEQEVQKWENNASKIRRAQEGAKNTTIELSENPEINTELNDVVVDFLNAYKLLQKKDFNKINPYSNTNEPNQFLYTLLFYFMQDDRFFDSPLLRKDISEPSLDKGTLTIGGYGCGKTSTFMALLYVFNKHIEFVKKEMPKNQKEILKKYDILGCISSDVVNKYNTIKKSQINDVLNPLMGSKQLYVDDILREQDGDNYGRLNIFKTILTHRADFGYKTHLTMNYLEYEVDGNVFFKNTEESLLKFRSRYDGRIYDRVFGMYNIIQLEGKSFRR